MWCLGFCSRGAEVVGGNVRRGVGGGGCTGVVEFLSGGGIVGIHVGREPAIRGEGVRMVPVEGVMVEGCVIYYDAGG